jgi:D-alanyl-D-alanine carboxypeptidase (penicillin-binding protein 5/6)
MRGEQRPVPMYEQARALLDHGFALPDLRGVGTLTDSNPAEPAEPGTTSTPDPDAAAPESGATTSWGTPVLLLAVIAAVGGLFALRAGRR